MSGRAWLAGKLCMLAVSTTLISVIASGEVGATEERRSGTVLAIEALDHATSTLVLRVGPWRMKEEDVVLGNVPLRLTLNPSTEIVVVTRSASAGSNGPAGSLIETPANAEALESGLFVTVTFTQSGPALVADRVLVIAEPLTLYPTPPSAPSSLAVHPK